MQVYDGSGIPAVVAAPQFGGIIRESVDSIIPFDNHAYGFQSNRLSTEDAKEAKERLVSKYLSSLDGMPLSETES